MIRIEFGGEDVGSVIDSGEAFMRSLVTEYSDEPTTYQIRSHLADWLAQAPEPREYCALIMALCGITTVDGTIDHIIESGVASPLIVPVAAPTDRESLEDIVVASHALRRKGIGDNDGMINTIHRHVCPECGKRGRNNIGACMNIGAYTVQIAYRSIEVAAHKVRRADDANLGELFRKFGRPH